MPTFDIVSKIDMQEVTNAVANSMKEITQRYDFKGSKSNLELKEKSIVLDDYKTMDIIGKGKKTIKNGSQDKGHNPEVASFLASIKEGQQLPISFTDCYNSTEATFKVMDKIKG